MCRPLLGQGNGLHFPMFNLFSPRAIRDPMNAAQKDWNAGNAEHMYRASVGEVNENRHRSPPHVLDGWV
jgi:hypothetical protein